PGELFSYSNDAYALLGAIIEKVTGITYEDYVMEEIIKPCQMSQTHFLIEDYGEYDNVTTCYEWNEATDEIYAVEDWWDGPPLRATGFFNCIFFEAVLYPLIVLLLTYFNITLIIK